MNQQKEDLKSRNLDHLGIIAGIIDEIGIVEKINEIFLIDSREKINTGEVVKAIILNGLGFVSKPLYLFSQFFEDKAIEHLLGEALPSNKSKRRIKYILAKPKVERAFALQAKATAGHFIIWRSQRGEKPKI